MALATGPDGMKRVLEVFPFFSTLPQKTRDAVLSRAVTKKLDHKQVLVRDGGECSWLPFVLEGTLRLYKTSPTGREITLYRIQKGESCILSATCIMNGGSFPAVAEAEGATEILLVPSKLIAQNVEDNPDWRRYLFGLYAKRLEEVLTLVDEVAFHHMDARLAALLLRRASGSPAVVSTTHVQIADELGTSREVVTRILADFEADGLIETSRGRIRLGRPEDLRKRAVPYSAV
jgi:CRP/FNR family transcriptional regulator